jgi:heme-degrading monooxygenase HmoA
MERKQNMIARIWHGMTPAEKADEYFEFLKKTGVTDYQSVAGNRGVTILRRIEGDRAHFLLLTLWDSMEAIRAFAGPDVDKAKYYPEDGRFLLEFEEQVVHYTVLLDETTGR